MKTGVCHILVLWLINFKDHVTHITIHSIIYHPLTVSKFEFEKFKSLCTLSSTSENQLRESHAKLHVDHIQAVRHVLFVSNQENSHIARHSPVGNGHLPSPKVTV